jgi:hypothetical protein
MFRQIWIVNPIVYTFFKDLNGTVAKLYLEAKPRSLNGNVTNTLKINMGWKLSVIIVGMEYLPEIKLRTNASSSSLRS